MMLSPHFSLAEAVRSDTALRLGIDNSKPDDAALENMEASARGMEQVRAILGNAPVIVHSWYRCQELERVLCRKDFESWCARHKKPLGSLAEIDAAWLEYFSRKGHPRGFCIDFTAPQAGTPEEIVKRLVRSGLVFDQIILEGTWVHISFDPRARRQVLTAHFDGGKVSYTQGLAA